jgi:hypothetical protein
MEGHIREGGIEKQNPHPVAKNATRMGQPTSMGSVESEISTQAKIGLKWGTLISSDFSRS